MPTTAPMLDILTAQPTADGRLHLRFSDATAGAFDASWLADKSGSLLVSLRQPAFFARAIVDGGALCWPNGLALSADTVHTWLRERRDTPPVHQGDSNRRHAA